MWKRLKESRLERAIDRIHTGEAVAVRGVAEYRGRDYTVEVKPKEAAESTTAQLPMGCVSHTRDAMTLSAQLEEKLLGPRKDGRDHLKDLPWLTLPVGYSFKVTFPFCGAAARFRVSKSDRPDRDVSVYLDTKHVLGYFGPTDKPEPYWEAYPIGGDTARFALAESTELIAAIVAELEKDA